MIHKFKQCCLLQLYLSGCLAGLGTGVLRPIKNNLGFKVLNVVGIKAMKQFCKSTVNKI